MLGDTWGLRRSLRNIAVSLCRNTFGLRRVDFGLVYSVVNQAIYFGVTFPIGMRRPQSVECAIWRIKSARRRDFEHGEIGPDLFRAACRFGLEGMVAKR